MLVNQEWQCFCRDRGTSTCVGQRRGRRECGRGDPHQHGNISHPFSCFWKHLRGGSRQSIRSKGKICSKEKINYKHCYTMYLCLLNRQWAFIKVRLWCEEAKHRYAREQTKFTWGWIKQSLNLNSIILALTLSPKRAHGYSVVNKKFVHTNMNYEKW